MKKGITNSLVVKINTDLDLCEKIEFRFQQLDKIKDFIYPSDEAIKIDEDKIALLWTKEDRSNFNAGKVLFDVRITYQDSDEQPDTGKIKQFEMFDSLFD